jgi:hypothetical protein
MPSLHKKTFSLPAICRGPQTPPLKRPPIPRGKRGEAASWPLAGGSVRRLPAGADAGANPPIHKKLAAREALGSRKGRFQRNFRESSFAFFSKGLERGPSDQAAFSMESGLGPAPSAASAALFLNLPAEITGELLGDVILAVKSAKILIDSRTKRCY